MINFKPSIIYNSAETFQLHIHKQAREKYKIDYSLFSISGDLIISDFFTARILSEKINTIRKSEGKLDELVTAGEINAAGLVHEIFHYIFRLYEERDNPDVFKKCLQHLNKKLKPADVNKSLKEFINEFPPLPVYKKAETASSFLNGKSGKKSNKEILLEELILLHFENINLAEIKLKEFFDDSSLKSKTKYDNILTEIELFFDKEKPFGKTKQSVIRFIKNPLLTFPYSLDDQINFIKENWSEYLTENILNKILTGQDLIKEDQKIFFPPAPGKFTPPVPKYEIDEKLSQIMQKQKLGKKLSEEETEYLSIEHENFTDDINWMPEVVLIAKNTYVWLDQLSKKYQRHISTLDKIPDEELDLLKNWNFTALWLIGIWERSSASKKIKQLTGNPEAISSAYSLFDYEIASDLGGEAAFQNLKQRALLRGIRLASDMVPNHTGIYSKWIIEHPDYFIQTTRPPFPSYSFSGPNLSDDSSIEIRIEDKYFDRTDAAIVFERKDLNSGDIRYIYHGNDGTNMPWNDTAQLDLIKPEVREALIQTIINVAKKFPIIRFDAAMTLTKKHFSRLWYPSPGSGGDIPSRSDYSMTQADFNNAMPKEFWREVVDRINSELPNTLLLAEAFWLMEGYFVRTLGMHRVYNSAFMHMLMKEENDKYRKLIKNTLAFNPEILKRYVNFMSNPDEETAVNQFGKGDKYFGVAVLMCTLPGLPMFAHGQIEGFAEKYGMEYKCAYYNEYPDSNLIKRHYEEIFPLIKKRYLFSQVDNFQLYDFIDNNGIILEDVFAFSNAFDSEKVLIFYNNSYPTCTGCIKYAAPKKTNNTATNDLAKTSIADILAAKDEPGYFYSYSDFKTNKQFLLKGTDLKRDGFFTTLKGYEYKIFTGFSEIFDDSGEYEELYYHLAGLGVNSLEETKNELKLYPLHIALQDIFSEDSLLILKDFIQNKSALQSKSKSLKALKLPELVETKIIYFLDLFEKHSPSTDCKQILPELEFYLYSLQNFNLFYSSKGKELFITEENKKIEILFFEEENFIYSEIFYLILFLITLRNELKKSFLFDKLLLSYSIKRILRKKESNESRINRFLYLIKIFSSVEINNLLDNLCDVSKNLPSGKAGFEEKSNVFIINILSFTDVLKFIEFNEFEGINYFSKERFEELLNWCLSFYLFKIFIKLCDKHNGTEKNWPVLEKHIEDKLVKEMDEAYDFAEKYFNGIIKLSRLSGYDYDKFIDSLKGKNVVSVK